MKICSSNLGHETTFPTLSAQRIDHLHQNLSPFPYPPPPPEPTRINRTCLTAAAFRPPTTHMRLPWAARTASAADPGTSCPSSESREPGGACTESGKQPRWKLVIRSSGNTETWQRQSKRRDRRHHDDKSMALHMVEMFGWFVTSVVMDLILFNM